MSALRGLDEGWSLFGWYTDYWKGVRLKFGKDINFLELIWFTKK